MKESVKSGTTPGGPQKAAEFLRASRELCNVNAKDPAVRERAQANLRGYIDARALVPSPAAAGSASVRTAAHPTVVRSTGAAVSSAAKFTQADVDAAFARGVLQERSRVSAVFASEHSRGRERGCAALLMDGKGWSAKEIAAELPNLPTDAQIAARRSRSASAAGAPPPASNGKSSAERWDAASAAIEARRVGQRPAAESTPGEQADAAQGSSAVRSGKSSADRWAKANEQIGKRGGA